jgi:tetratricopeptide (TPR) repeat protein
MDATRRRQPTKRRAMTVLLVACALGPGGVAAQPAPEALLQPGELATGALLSERSVLRPAPRVTADDDLAPALGLPPLARAPKKPTPVPTRRPDPSADAGRGEPRPFEAPATTDRLDRRTAAGVPNEVDRLEASASIAVGADSLTKLINRCRTLADDGSLDAGDRSRLAKLRGWATSERGRLREQSGDFAGALDDYRDAVEADPASTGVRHDLAIALAASGDHAAALREFDAIVAADPRSALALQNRAAARAASGDIHGALDDCEGSYALLAADDLGRRAVVLQWGRLLNQADRSRETIKLLRDPLRESPRDAALLTLRGHANALLGKDRDAVNDYRAALWSDPTSVEAYRCVAWVLASTPDATLRDPAQALEAAWRARQLGGGDDPLVLEASAAALAASGQFDEAVEVQRRVVQASGEGDASGSTVRLALYAEGKPYTAPRPIAPGAAAGR